MDHIHRITKSIILTRIQNGHEYIITDESTEPPTEIRFTREELMALYGGIRMLTYPKGT